MSTTTTEPSEIELALINATTDVRVEVDFDSLPELDYLNGGEVHDQALKYLSVLAAYPVRWTLEINDDGAELFGVVAFKKKASAEEYAIQLGAIIGADEPKWMDGRRGRYPGMFMVVKGGESLDVRIHVQVKGNGRN